MDTTLPDVFRLIGGEETAFPRMKLSNGHFHSFPRDDPRDPRSLCTKTFAGESHRGPRLHRRYYELLTFLWQTRSKKRRPFKSFESSYREKARYENAFREKKNVKHF